MDPNALGESGPMTENYIHHEMFPLGDDTTPYRLLTSEHVGTRQVDSGRSWR